MKNGEVLVIDPYMGAAGDMFVGALAGLGVDFSKPIEALSDVGTVEIHKVNYGYRVSTQSHLSELDTEEVLDIMSKIMEKVPIVDPYREFALRALRILIEAEKWAHRTFRIGEGGHLHEISDIVIDLILVAYGLQILEAKKIYCLYPIMVGEGIIRFSHGVFEVPAPATRWIIDNYMLPTKRGPYDVELLTPTGAAIIAALQPIFVDRRDLEKNFIIESIGVGLGHRKLPELNALKIYVATERKEPFLEEIVELETTIDDIAPEYLSYIYGFLDAYEITITPAIGKKNRLAMILRVLCSEEKEKECVEKIFRATGTLGIRRKVVRRYVRPRRYEVRHIIVDGHEFRVIFKEGKPEYSQILRIAKKMHLTPLEVLRKLQLNN